MIVDQKTASQASASLSMCPPEEVNKWGTTLIIASHPDDVTLECGGAIALLRQLGYRVHVLLLTDGVNNHPNASLFHPSHFRAIRRRETLNALASLSVSEDSVKFLGLHDTLLPIKGESGFKEVTRIIRNELNSYMPDTIITPWKMANSKDHRATWQMTNVALEKDSLHEDVRHIGYSNFLNTQHESAFWTSHREVKSWRLDTNHVIEKKLNALSAYQSQHSFPVANNAVQGEAYYQTVLSQSVQSWELYME